MTGAIRERDFECLECGRHIFRFVAYENEPDLCMMCVHAPGWFRHPEIRAILDPDLKDEDLPEHERHA